MNKFRKNNKLNYLKYGALVLLLMLTLGYALLSANLNITGTSNFARTTWNIHFENLVPSTNMTLGNGEGASITQNKTTEVTYTLNFTEPGQYYEFLVDAKNDGTIDGMVNTVTSTIKIGDATAVPITTSPSNLPAYLEYTATYSDGTPIAQYHLLEAGEAETYKVRIAFSTDIDATDLPGSDQTLELTFGVEYVQKDSNATPSHPEGNYVYSTYYWTDDDNDDNYGTDVTIGDTYDESNNTIFNTDTQENVKVFNTPEEVMAAFQLVNEEEEEDILPAYFKHEIVDNQVQKTYLVFVLSDKLAQLHPEITTGTYTLEYGNNTNNINIIDAAFNISNCYDENGYYKYHWCGFSGGENSRWFNIRIYDDTSVEAVNDNYYAVLNQTRSDYRHFS